jgi:hypothetical protein
LKGVDELSTKALHFQIAKLRVLFNQTPDSIIREGIIKRYGIVRNQIKKREIPWTWNYHILDDLIVKGPGSFIKPNKPAWRIFDAKEVFDIPEFSLPSRVDIKIDGMRIQIHYANGVKFLSEDEGLDKTEKFKMAAKEVEQLPKGTVLDSEGVIVDKGEVLHRTTFIGYANGEGYDENLDSKAEFWVFDILFYQGKDLRNLPYSERLTYLDKIKTSEHLRPFQTGKESFTCRTREEILAAVKKVSDMKGSEGAMIKFLNGTYVEGVHNKTWVKIKNLKEIDCMVVEIEQPKHQKGPLEGKPIEGVYNYHIAAGPYDDKCASFLKEKDPKKIREVNGKTYAYLGKTFNTSIAVKVGNIIRIWTPEVNRYPIEDSGCSTFGVYEPKVLEHVAERNIPDSMNVLMRLSAETVPRQLGKQESNSMYLPRHSCMMVWSGIKTQIVKEKPFEGMLNKELYLCDDHYFYGEIELTSMKKVTRKEVEQDIHLNRIFGEDWEDWKGAREFYSYEFTFEAVFEPQVVDVPKGAQTFFSLDPETVLRIERVRTSADFIGLLRKVSKDYKFVLHRHYGSDLNTHFDLRWMFDSTHKEEFNLYGDPRTMDVGSSIDARRKSFTESPESLALWMVTEGEHLERHVRGVDTPTYIDVIDSGTLKILLENDLNIELEIDGRSLKGFFLYSKEPKASFKKVSSFLVKDEEHGPPLSEYEGLAKDGEPLPSKFYKWQPECTDCNFVLQRHYPTGRKEPIKPGEEVPQMHKDLNDSELADVFLEGYVSSRMGCPPAKMIMNKAESSPVWNKTINMIIRKIRDHLDLRMEIDKKLIGVTIHPPVPEGITAWESFQGRMHVGDKTQVTPKFEHPKGWLNEEGELRFPTRHTGPGEEVQQAHFLEIAQIQILDKGQVKFGVQRKDLHEYFFYGEKLKGRWVLRRLKIGLEFQHDAWLLMKPEDQKPLDPSYHKDEGYWKIDFIEKVTTEERAHIEEEVQRSREERGGG